MLPDAAELRPTGPGTRESRSVAGWPVSEITTRRTPGGARRESEEGS
jgi:hypothetical protein